MSAFVVVKPHVDALIQLAVDGPPERERYPGDCYGPRWLAEPVEHWQDAEWRSASSANRDEIGDMLVRECVRSVSYRYQDNDDLPGPIEPYYLAPYAYERPPHCPTAVEGLKLIACYEYQSCEHPQWETSQAKRFCDALRSSLIDALPGYDDAPWEYTGPQVTA